MREATLAALYAETTGGEAELPADLPPAAAERLRAGLEGVRADPGRWDGCYSAHLAPGWSVGRLGVVDRTVLRMACWEMWEAPGVPGKVTVAEHVALAKKFGDRASASFVHAVLAKVLADSPKAGLDPVEEPDEGWVPEPAPGADGLPRKRGWKVRAGAE